MSVVANNNWSEAAEAFLKKKLESTEYVLQYGCGDATAIACEASKVKYILAVEANKNIADSIYDTLANKDKLRMMYSNIGDLSESGQPINNERYKDYHQYMIFPWALADKYDAMPSLVIIDGQFKVASFLYSLVCAPEGTTILVNGYFDHPEYAVMREYALLESKHGSAAEFTVQKNYAISELTAMIAKFSVITE